MGIYKFDRQLALAEVVGWIKAQSEEHKFTQVVLGISGGKDSTIAAALCCRALGKENVHGLLLPNGIQSDINDSIEVCKTLGIKYDTINIKPIYDMFVLQHCMFTLKDDVKMLQDDAGCVHFIDNTDKDVSFEQLSNEAKINLLPRLRMAMLRLWGQNNHHRLCGTGNLSEITVGYCTKDGDTSCDFNPLGGLTSIEVVEIGKLLKEIPQRLVTKIPSDGLCGVSDEEKLGVSYISIHKYIREIMFSSTDYDIIHNMELKGLHKRTNAPIYIPSIHVFGG